MNEDNLQEEKVNKKRLEKVGKYLTDREFSMFEEVSEIKEHLEGIHESLKTLADKNMLEIDTFKIDKVIFDGAKVITVKGDDGKTPTEDELLDLITPLIPEPIKGDDYILTEEDKKEIASKIDVPIVEKIIEKTEVIKEVALKDTPYETRDKLEEIDNEKEKLRISAIQDLEKRLDELEKRPIGKGGGGTSAIGVARAFKYIAHTKQPTGVIDGVNLTYIVPGISTIWWIAGFTLNGENIAELPNFTYSGATITFASALPAAYSGKDFEVKLIGT